MWKGTVLPFYKDRVRYTMLTFIKPGAHYPHVT
jgi:hypothetical protein